MKFWDFIKAAFLTEYGAADAQEESKLWDASRPRAWEAPRPKVELDGGVVAGLRKALEPVQAFIREAKDHFNVSAHSDIYVASVGDKKAVTLEHLEALAEFAEILAEAPQWPAAPYGPSLLRGLDDYTVQRCADIARSHAHHALWQGVAEYGTYGMDTGDQTLELFGRRLAHRIADKILNEPNSIRLRRQGPKRDKPTRESVLASHLREMFWHLSLAAAVEADPVKRAELIMSLVDQAAVCASIEAVDQEAKRRRE